MTLKEHYNHHHLHSRNLLCNSFKQMQTENTSPISQSLVLDLSTSPCGCSGPCTGCCAGKVCTIFSSATLQCNAFPYIHSTLTSCLIAFLKFCLLKLKIKAGLLNFSSKFLASSALTIWSPNFSTRHSIPRKIQVFCCLDLLSKARHRKKNSHRSLYGWHSS